jgi:NADPH-dependent 2,4-dienoyl-CoA reductase/sulfur reductase-like enzyme/nitrite reductase/ring-hydroxylating ferredoxin subunit
MSQQSESSTGPDLARGIAIADVDDGTMLQGHVGDTPVLLARRGDEFFAIGAKCTHYSAPLAKGLLVGDTVRCPWHHACFSLRTGEALRAPALDPVDCWTVERRGTIVAVAGKADAHRRGPAATPATTASTAARRSPPARIVIVGGGAAGNAAAEKLRQQGFDGSVTMVSDDASVPYDRPNLSKDYLAGEAQEDWIPIRSEAFYEEQKIRLLVKTSVRGIDARAKEVHLSTGETIGFDALLLATGAEPVRLQVPGSDLPHVRTLRSLADSRAIIELAERSKRAVVMGASFIGLEVAASLRTRGLHVQVVAPDRTPLERVLGPELGARVRAMHEDHGVVFRLGTVAASIGRDAVTLDTGEVLPADLVVAGIGVRPRVALAERAGLAADNGVVVNEYLESSVPGIYAAGDIARWPDAVTGRPIRVEHWVLAERHGQVAAVNMMGRREAFRQAPFFWSAHYDTSIRYVGHAEKWDRVEIDGDLGADDCRVAYVQSGRTLAVATLGRDRANLEAEVELERLGPV